MWKCSNCSEKSEKNFDSCWNCGYSRKGVPPTEQAQPVSSDPLLVTGEFASVALKRAIGNAETSETSETSDRVPLAASRSPRKGFMQCRECQREISRKAEICPHCGIRLKNKPPGLFASLFKMVFGAIGGIIGIVVAISFLSNGKEKSNRTADIEGGCRTLSLAMTDISERESAYTSCVASAKETLRARGVSY